MRMTRDHKKLLLHFLKSQTSDSIEAFNYDDVLKHITGGQPNRGARLLDIGCGSGEAMHHLPYGIEYYGIDPVRRPNVKYDFKFFEIGLEAIW